MKALFEGGQGPEEAAVPYMDEMNGQIQKNRQNYGFLYFNLWVYRRHREVNTLQNVRTVLTIKVCLFSM